MLLDLDALPVHGPWRVVPRIGGRWLGDLDADPLTVRTIQPEAVYRALLKTGEALPDPALAEPDFDAAYEWMTRMAAERLTPRGRDDQCAERGRRGLFWVWARVRSDTIRDCAKHARGQVLLMLRVPAMQVLLSAFDAWHIVLNDGFHVPPLPGESDEDWCARAEPIWDDFDARADAAKESGARLTHDLRVEQERSWVSIFDPTCWRPDQTIQGVVHAIKAEQIVEAARVR